MILDGREYGGWVAPEPYNDWNKFWDQAPQGTVIQFVGEAHTWTAIGKRGNWKSSGGLERNKSHLQHYTFKGVIVRLAETEPEKFNLGLPGLVALEEYVNKKIEEAYERGKKDGHDAAYVAGYDDGHRQGYSDARYDYERGDGFQDE